ncbi:MAG: DegT/DnrJ/EryC1/StrS family aminotransferase, partial [Bacilli bacterium]|nr:DegT/DnrJ/EryC1/StrS family aminotransferase [Bacilli bacterium]
NGKNAGQAADITCFSFHAVKNLTTAEGGAVTWTNTFGMTDEEMYREYMLLSLHGQSKDALAKMQKGAWEYDIIYPAYKCNMTDILAAVGLIQLKRYDLLLLKRYELIDYYYRHLDRKVIMLSHKSSSFSSSAHLLICNIENFTIDQRNDLIVKLAELGIATNVHYKPLPMFTAYKNLGFEINDYPNAYKQFVNEITLPLHTLLTLNDIKYIANHVNKIINKRETDV